MIRQADEHHIITIDDSTTLSYSERRRIYQKLHLAAFEGDWKKAKFFYRKYEPEISYNTKITNRDETVLHIAVGSDRVGFVKHVVRMMSDADLELQDDAGNTAFFLAVITGKVKCLDVMMKRKPNLAITRSPNHELPLYVAASRGYSKIVGRFYDATKSKSDWEYEDKINIFIALISSNICGVALDMVKDDDRLAIGEDANKVTALLVLAQNPSLTADFSSPNEQGKWKKFIWHNSQVFVRWKSPLENCFYSLVIDERSMMRKKAFELMKCIWERVMELDDSEIIPTFLPPIYAALEKGNTEFLTILFHSFPNLMVNLHYGYNVRDKYLHNGYNVDDGYTIFHMAIMHRQEDVFRLITDLYPVTQKMSTCGDTDGNNMLHIAAMLPLIASRLEVVPGAALQLQRELLWFEEVKKLVPVLSPCLQALNNKSLTPEDVFVESHKKMLEDGEKWMKGTAGKSIVVAALIATMVFEAVLDGKNQFNSSDLEVEIVYLVFLVAVAVALVLSVSSVMIFLGIITCQYNLCDFRRSLPRKLMLGLLTLFLSLVAMLVAFCLATFGLSTVVVGIVPIICFILMHYRVLTNVYVQTFRSDLVFKRKKLLYNFYN